MIADTESIGTHIVILTPKGTREYAEKLAKELLDQNMIGSYEIIEEDI